MSSLRSLAIGAGKGERMKPKYVKPQPPPLYDDVYEQGVAALNAIDNPTRVVHCKREPYDVYIGRPSKWGNPFSHLPKSKAEIRTASREEALVRYEEWIKSRPDLLSALGELRGKVLGCWCRPKACHGDVLARLADDLV